MAGVPVMPADHIDSNGKPTIFRQDFRDPSSILCWPGSILMCSSCLYSYVKYDSPESMGIGVMEWLSCCHGNVSFMCFPL